MRNVLVAFGTLLAAVAAGFILGETGKVVLGTLILMEAF